MAPSSTSFRTRLTLLFFAFSLGPLVASTAYFLNLYKEDKVASLFESELLNTSQSASRLESLLTLANFADDSVLANLVKESRDFITVIPDPCSKPPGAPLSAFVSKLYESTLERLKLTPNHWSASANFRNACQNLSPASAQVILEVPRFPYPILAVLTRPLSSPSRLSIISMEGLGGADSSEFGLFTSQPTPQAIWNSSLSTKSTPLPKEVNQIVSKTFESGLSSTQKTEQGLIIATSPVKPNWAFYSVAHEEEVLQSVRFVMMQALYLTLGCMLTYLLIGKFVARQISTPLALLRQAAEKIAAGDLTVRLKVDGSGEISIVQAAFNAMTDRITQLIEMTKKQAHIESDLALAQKVQQWFFPETLSHPAGHEIHGTVQMAASCGGDWWSYVEVPIPNQQPLLILLIGDAAGHGISSALLTAAVQGGMTTLRDLLFAIPEEAADPRKILRIFNKLIFKSTGGDVHMSFFVAVLDSNKDELKVANAGHNRPYLLMLPSDPIKSIGPDGPVLGYKAGETFDEVEVYPWKRGYQLFLYTDGLIDCQKDNQDLFNRKALVQQLKKHNQLKGATLVKELLRARKTSIGSLPQEDDVTTVICTRL